MASLFKTDTPKVTPVSPAPPPPDRTSDETAALAAEQRARFAKGGRAFTMLTGGTGADSGSTAMRFLGGAART